MPVSPQDFELYSRMTGTPLPSDAMSRMQMAPEVFKFTKSGGILAIFADQRVSTGEKAEFFGKPALTTPLVGLLAKRAKASVVSLTLKYEKSCKLKVKFRLVDFDKANTSEVLAKLTNQELEQVITNDMTSGFWFHDRFKM